MFSKYRNRKNSEYSDNDHENAFIQFSNFTQSATLRNRSCVKIKPYVSTFDDILLSMKLESLYLEATTPPMKRYSSPTRDHCFHCAHDHNQSCCLYYYDTESDKKMYSKWKRELETEKSYYVRNTVPKIPEALAGNTTPTHFPGFTYNNPEFIECRIGHYTNQNHHSNGGKKRWFRQFYYPLFAMDIIPTISGIAVAHAPGLPPPPVSVIRSPPEIRPLSTLPTPPVPMPTQQEEPNHPDVPKMCCNAHNLANQYKTTKNSHNHYYNNNRYYHYHHHHYNNYNNYDNQQADRFIPTKYFYNKKTTAYHQSKKQKKNRKRHTNQEVRVDHQSNRDRQRHKNYRHYNNKQNQNDLNDDWTQDAWNNRIGQISTNMIHEIPYMYFY